MLISCLQFSRWIAAMGSAGRLQSHLPLAALALWALLAAAPQATRARTWQRLDLGTDGGSWTRLPQPGPAPGVRLMPADGERAAAGPTSRLIPMGDPVVPAPDGGISASGTSATGISARPSTEIEAAPGRMPGLNPLLAPFLSGGQPTGFAGRWGDYSISGSAATPGKQRGGQPDGSVNLAMSFGDPIRAVGVDLNWGVGSVRNFGANGGLSASVGRVLVNKPGLTLAVAGGLIDVYTYGNEGDVTTPLNGYGALTMAVPLQPNNPGFPRILQLTAGGGGSLFAPLGSDFKARAYGGAFGAVGVEVTRNLGASVGVSGRGANVSLSYIPIHDVPIFVNLLAADVFNKTPYGTIGVLTVGWGDNFRTGFFNN